MIDAAPGTLDSALDSALSTLSSVQHSVLRNPYSALRLSQVGLTVYAQSACGWRLGVGGLIDAAPGTLDSALDSALRTLSSVQHSVLRNPYSALRLSQVGLTVYAQSACGWRLGLAV